MLIAKTNTQIPGMRKHTVTRAVSLGQVSFKFITIGLLAALALLYLAQNTQSANRSYQLRSLTEERVKLQQERERLEVESIRLRSLDSIGQNFSTAPGAEGQPAAWEPVTNVAYIHGTIPVAGR